MYRAISIMAENVAQPAMHRKWQILALNCIFLGQTRLRGHDRHAYERPKVGDGTVEAATAALHAVHMAERQAGLR